MLFDRAYKGHQEAHYAARANWLRAAVLGANDGIISVSALMVGVVSATAAQGDALLAGVAGLVAGAMSMAAGEYVSVSSQSDMEKADLERERKELETMPEAELQELTDIYVGYGVEEKLAREVSRQMMAKDALGAHAREELGISEVTTAKPLQAAIASAAAFSVGAAFPVLSIFFIPATYFAPASSAFCIILLGLLGTLAAWAGGASPLKPALRVMFWGAAAMGLSALVGELMGTAVF